MTYIATIAAMVLAQAANAQGQSAQTVQPPAPSADVSQPATEPAPNPAPSAAPVQAAPQTGKIVMYRGSSIMGMGIACPVRYKEQQLVELARGKFAEWVVPAGRYILTNHTSSVEVAVDPGETRYVR
jgi:hypothetical protein